MIDESTSAEGAGEENSAMKSAGEQLRESLREKLKENVNITTY